LGDIIDARDETMGAWFEAKIVKVTKTKGRADEVVLGETSDEPVSESSPDDSEKTNSDKHCDGFLYSIVFERCVVNPSALLNKLMLWVGVKI
jgi:Tandem tudor domain within UHRF1